MDEPCSSEPGTAPAKLNNFRTCSVFGCLNTNSIKRHLSFFKLPVEEERRLRWLYVMDREDLQDKNPRNFEVCEEHFEPGHILKGTGRKRLAKFAMPSLMLPTKRVYTVGTQTELEPPSLNKFVQTEFYVFKLDTGCQTPQHITASIPVLKNLKEELTECKRKLKVAESKILNRDNFHTLCDKYLSKPLAEIVKAHTKLKKHATSNRYPLKYKQFCINLFYTSPQAYKLLTQAFCLPNVKTLVRSAISITTETNDQLITTLKLKVSNMTNTEKICSVVVDAIVLKKNLYYNIKLDKIIGLHEINGVQSPLMANYALVVMIRSIFGTWKQPIGFALLSECKYYEELSPWIEKLLETLLDIGLDIRTFVADLDIDVLSTDKRNAITVDTPYFYIKDRKIYYVIDPRWLIIALRDNFLLNDFCFQGSVAKFEHVLQVYETEKNKSMGLVPTLSDSHIKPNSLKRTKLEYATDLLSNTVATAISCYVDFQVIDQSAKGTVVFIKNMNDLFDILNSSTEVLPANEYKKPFCGTPTQVSFMKEMIHFFQHFILINTSTGEDVTSTAKFVNGFLLTIASVLNLHDDLRLEGYNNLLTSRLNRDVIEQDLLVLRSKKRNPTARMFVVTFRNALFSSIIKPGKKGKNSDDLTELLTNTEKMGMSLGESLDQSMEVSDDGLNQTNQESTYHNISISSAVYKDMKLPDNGGLKYVCEFIFKKCINIHKDCDLFNAYVYDKKPTVYGMDVDNTENREDEEVKPPGEFMQFVEDMENQYQNLLNNLHENCRITKAIIKSLRDIEFPVPCPCFPIDYIKMLFVRMRNYITIKYNNNFYLKLRKRVSSQLVVDNL